MHVVATAGHVDHGKSTLIRALTGMEPDRLAAERSRGMSIDLGFCWTTTAQGQTVAFVDVPGHERYLGNALAGVGPAPAVLFTVAADEGWMPQAEEHLTGIDAFGIRHGVLAVTRADLADPATAMAQARNRLARTSLRDIPALAVSAVSGDGVDTLLSVLDDQLARLTPPGPAAPTRLWVDRSFSARGSGTVVTGTLTGGTITAGDEVYVPRLDRTLRVRGLQCLGQPVDDAPATARVAVNLRHIHAGDLTRGDSLVSPTHWLRVATADVRCHGDSGYDLPREILVHAGTAAIAAATRPLGADTVRLHLSTPLPLHIGDRIALRAPGSRRITGATVLDPQPPALRRRGAARTRAAELATATGIPDTNAELDRRGPVREGLLRALGAPPATSPLVGDWHVSASHIATIGAAIHAVVLAAPGPLSVEAIRQQLELPDARLVAGLLPDTVRLRAGLVEPTNGPPLPPGAQAALDRLEARLAAAPFDAPDGTELAHLGVDHDTLDAAVRQGRLVRIGANYLLPDAPDRAIEALRGLPQPFTASEARLALRTSRRVIIPLLEHLDQLGATECRPDRRRAMS
ncbi:SelB C-terminal domain-containing protein [Micromonospora sp. WMMD812]|uniref:SelB domain-containing protein n=1 Tax=Micromonospora sp. WMMD812 TaxID=3015152 RepID=UPI00248B096E|nr:SelB C-terminal domain-containing protein [Micromonospora sp. WMMD812]WBB70076.1 SelB C-terminal domain-containing protein [Micromonospora sp. WMMD812]